MVVLASPPTRSELAVRPQVRAVQIGCVVARSLQEGVSGIVRAVFERSVYLTLNQQWICVGPRGLGAGPLNVLCEPTLAGAMTKGIGGGAPVVWAGRTLRVGAFLEISFADAAPWMPDPPGIWTQATLERGLLAFPAALPEILPAEGLALLLRPATEGQFRPPVAAVAQAPAQRLGELVRAAVSLRETDAKLREQVPSKLTHSFLPLLGLGPGLTPSGDDFLGGALIALHLVGLTPLRDAIWVTLEPLVAPSTNNISGAHLVAAAEGFGGAALHALLNDLIAGRTAALPERIAALAAIGHTSGWDALAGAVTVLRGRTGRVNPSAPAADRWRPA